MSVIIGKQLERFTIAEIKKDPNKFWPNPEYQRSEAWRDEKRRKLLASILQNLPIGVLFVRKHEDGKYEILDGQQRIETIKKFLNNSLKTPQHIKGVTNKTYSDLEKDTGLDSEFLGYPIWYIPVYGGNETEIADIFLILQEGQPLNTPERLNAIQSEMKHFIIKVSKHPTFTKSRLDQWRFGHRNLAAQCVYFYLNSNFDKNEFPNPPRLGDLITMYRNVSVSKGLHKAIYGTLDFIYQSLQDEIQIIRKKSDVAVLFTLAHHVRTNYSVDHEIFRFAISNFITEVENAEIQEGKPSNDFEEYKQLRKSGATQENFTTKFQIILREFEKVEVLVRKDKKRHPSFGLTLKVYYRDKKVCSYCSKKVKFDDISIDHINQHHKGGPTDVENLRLVHKGKCHVELEKQKQSK